jgi:hypothetical protein
MHPRQDLVVSLACIPFTTLELAAAVIARDVTAWEVIRAVLRVRLLWPLYGLVYLYVAMNLKMRWVEYRTRVRHACDKDGDQKWQRQRLKQRTALL